MGGIEMSDTPISDSTPHNVAELGMLCRRLERELTAANKTNRLQYELITTAEKRGVDKSKEELNAANERIKRLEAVVNDPHAMWANWLRGTVSLPAGIGDVRQYQDRIKRLEREVELLRLYGNKDCIAQADEVLKKEAKP
jgi:hypothetical protein